MSNRGRHGVRRSALGLAVAVVAWSTALEAQQSYRTARALERLHDNVRQRELTLDEIVEVEAVQLDVLVEARRRARPDGLPARAFEVRVDGRKVPLAYFEEVEATRCSETIVVLIDQTHLPRLEGFSDAVAAPLADLAERGCRVMALTYDGGFHQVLAATHDGDAIAPALRGVALDESATALWSQRRREGLRIVERAVLSLSQQSRLEDVTQTLASMFGRLRETAAAEHADGAAFLAALAELIPALGEIEGHKKLLVVSDGIPLQPLDVMLDVFGRASVRGAGAASSRTDPASQQLATRHPAEDSVPTALQVPVVPAAQSWSRGFEAFDLFDEAAAVAQAANTNRVSVFSVPVTESFLEEVEPRHRFRFGRSAFALSDLDSGLSVVAELTGGEAHVRGADPARFVENLLPTTHGRYVLGFDSPAGDPGFRGVRVKVRGRGLRAIHRAGYSSRTLNEELAARALASLHLGRVANPHRLRVEFESMEPLPDGRGMSEVSLRLSFPIGTVDLTPTGVQHEAPLWVTAAYADARGRVAQMRQVEVPLVVPNAELEEARASDFAVILSLTMPTGSSGAVVGLWNRATDAASFIVGDIHVQDDGAR